MSIELRPQPAIARASLSPDLSGRRLLIEDIYPAVDDGRYPIKRIAGEPIEIWADIFRDGHDVLAAALLWRIEDAGLWQRTPMSLHSNDRWSGSFTPPKPGRYFYAIEAWTDTWGTWRRDILLKIKAGLDVRLEAQEGRALLTEVKGPAAERVGEVIAEYDRTGDHSVLLAEDLAELLVEAQPRPDLTWSPSLQLVAERPQARASAWYEIFPRSQSGIEGQHGTFDDVIRRVPEIADLGFDVLYFPPIHPIGRTNRKGRNNSLTAGPDDPGSPYAIGSEEGGHDAVHPQLGTLDDFRRLVGVCRDHGMEIALDFAIQCSPDHPWLREHPDWFRRRPDGTIKYAENPPKKYEDIVNPDFFCPDRAALWGTLKDVVAFWVDQGVRIFRVDNPHTKPFPFWEWMIREIQRKDPGVIFLSEAFTRPKVMLALAKVGFTQSYTYFTWRTKKAEFQEYLTELSSYPVRDYFRPNFFVNTPDILPYHLQGGERWMFLSRLALAATLAGNYGVYNGFELLEYEPVPGKEEYLNSEKYELKVRDYHRRGNINDYMRRLNRIRRDNPALLQTADIRFAPVDDDEVLGFVKESPDKSNAVAVAIVLGGPNRHEFWFHFGDLEIGPPEARRRVRAIEDLITGERYDLNWGGVRLAIDKSYDPARLFRCIA